MAEIIYDSGWGRVSSLREEYLKVVEAYERVGCKNCLTWEEFQSRVMPFLGDDVPVEHSDYDITISTDGVIKEEYNGNIHIVKPAN